MPMSEATFQVIRGHIVGGCYEEAIRLVTRDAMNHSERVEALRIAASLANAWELSLNRAILENPEKLTQALQVALNCCDVKAATITISDHPPVGGAEEG